MLSTTETYRGSVAVAMAPTRVAFVFDKDGTIKNETLNSHPSDNELSARKEIRSISSKYLELTSTAQDPGMGMKRATYDKSVEYGYDRPPPNWVVDGDGRYSYRDIDTLREFTHLTDFAATSNFGYGVGVINSGGYMFDHEYEVLLGGPGWRPSVLDGLAVLADKNPELALESRFARIESADNYYIKKTANVAPLPYRIQTDWEGEEGFRLKEKFALLLFAAQLRGLFPRNVVLVDESNPHKDRYTTYLVPKKAQKDRSIKWLFNQISFHSSVPLSECTVVTAGDTRTDLQIALYGLQGVKKITSIFAGGSRIAESLELDKPDFAGASLGWGRKYKDLPPRYVKTEPGVYVYRAHRLQSDRTIILADYAEFSRGLKGAESVLACMHHLGYKSSAPAS